MSRAIDLGMTISICLEARRDSGTFCGGTVAFRIESAPERNLGALKIYLHDPGYPVQWGQHRASGTAQGLTIVQAPGQNLSVSCNEYRSFASGRNPPWDVGAPWQRNRNFDVAPREAEFIPRLDHTCRVMNMLHTIPAKRGLTRLEVHVMISFLIKEAYSLLKRVMKRVAHLNHLEDKVSTLCGCLAGVVPLNVHGGPVMEIYGFPKWIIARVESAAIDVELVGEYKVIFVAVRTGACVGSFWGIFVYSKGDIEVGNLASKVDATDIKGGALFKLDKAVVCDYGISSEEDDETEEDCKESEVVCPAPSAPESPLRVLDSILTGVGVMEGVVEVWITRIPEVSRSPNRCCLLRRTEWFFRVRLLGDMAEAWVSDRLVRLLGLLKLGGGLARAVIGGRSSNIQHKGRNHRQCAL